MTFAQNKRFRLTGQPVSRLTPNEDCLKLTERTGGKTSALTVLGIKFLWLWNSLGKKGNFISLSHCTGTGLGPVQGPSGKYSTQWKCLTGWRRGPKPIVSYCTCTGPSPLQCDYTIMPHTVSGLVCYRLCASGNTGVDIWV